MLIGIDIGGTKCALTKGDGNGKIVEKIRFNTMSCEKTLEKIFEVLNNMGEFDAIGISCGGPLDSKKGIIMSPPNLPGWDDIHIVQMLYERFSVPILLQNDANACALAEHKFGAGKGTRNMVFLTFGTGLGAGLILDGKLYDGTNAMAGEVGHIRLEHDGPVGYGKPGSFEGFCSGSGIAQIGRKLAEESINRGEKVAYCPDINNIDQISAKDIALCAYEGDALSKEVYKICGLHLGMGISILIDILNPEMIVIGSIYERCTELLRPYVIETVEKEALSYARGVCQIVPAKLGDEIGDYAALAVAKTAYEERRGHNA